jgi:SAM-dependent methyltransferase
LMVFENYAKDYDIFYQKKDYKKECFYLKKIFKQFLSHNPQTILDLGCGTGNYLILLSKMGYQMTGVDASAQMLSIAQRKIATLKLKSDLYRGYLQSFKVKKKFDAVICLFSVIDYVTNKSDVMKTLRNIYDHLNPGGIFVFDFWQKETVERDYSKVRTNVFKGNNCQVERFSATKILPNKQLCEVNYHCVVTKGKKILNEYDEKHVLRYFSVLEMNDYLKKAKLKVLNVHPFMEFGSLVKKADWDVTIVAQK